MKPAEWPGPRVVCDNIARRCRYNTTLINHRTLHRTLHKTLSTIAIFLYDCIVARWGRTTTPNFCSPIYNLFWIWNNHLHALSGYLLPFFKTNSLASFFLKAIQTILKTIKNHIYYIKNTLHIHCVLHRETYLLLLKFSRKRDGILLGF